MAERARRRKTRARAASAPLWLRIASVVAVAAIARCLRDSPSRTREPRSRQQSRRARASPAGTTRPKPRYDPCDQEFRRMPLQQVTKFVLILFHLAEGGRRPCCLRSG